jgi:hypothetical protein
LSSRPDPEAPPGRCPRRRRQRAVLDQIINALDHRLLPALAIDIHAADGDRRGHAADGDIFSSGDDASDE